MKRRCNQEGCKAPIAYCKVLATPNYEECIHWAKDSEDKVSSSKKADTKKSIIPWTGTAMVPSDIEQLSHRSTPQIIGIVGAAGAGKTSYLGMLYTLLFNGKKFQNWSFAGSNTLIAWETQAKCLKVQPNGNVDYPEPTPRNRDYYSLYHLALKRRDSFSDVLFADSSGEVFTEWSKNTEDPNVENARWIYKNSDAFILFINCEDILIGKGKARNIITQLMGQLSAELDNRPVAVVWSKADRIDEVESKYPQIKKAIEASITHYLPDSKIIAISNFSSSDPDEYCHVNNLNVTEHILDTLNHSEPLILRPEMGETNDFFYHYRGNYGS